MRDEESILRMIPFFWVESQGTMFDRFTHATGKVLVSIVKLLMASEENGQVVRGLVNPQISKQQLYVCLTS